MKIFLGTICGLVLVAILFLTLKESHTPDPAPPVTQEGDFRSDDGSFYAFASPPLPDRDWKDFDLLADQLKDALELKEGGSDIEQIRRLLLEWLQADEASAIAFLQSLPDYPYDLETVASILNQYWSNMPESDRLAKIMAWAPQTAIREYARREVFFSWTSEAPTDVRQWISENHDFEMDSIFRYWMERDIESSSFEDSFKWIQEISDEDPRKERMITAGIIYWNDEEPDQLATYLNSVEPSALFDEGIDSYASSVAQQAPEEAMTWAESIFDPERRARSMANIAFIWWDQEPERFDQWYSQTLPADSPVRRIVDQLIAVEQDAINQGNAQSTN
ncbi:MAG: hypothetical protein AAF571_08240 [Verrucomicrobiota bacterium]